MKKEREEKKNRQTDRDIERETDTDRHRGVEAVGGGMMTLTPSREASRHLNTSLYFTLSPSGRKP